jgi:hypothetical protein
MSTYFLSGLMYKLTSVMLIVNWRIHLLSPSLTAKCVNLMLT